MEFRNGGKMKHINIYSAALAILLIALYGGPRAQAPDWDNQRPAWLGSERIVFTSNRDGNWEIYVIDTDGSGLKNLTNSPEQELFPGVSSDGSKIAFVGTNEENYDIYVMESDGSARRRLTNHEGIDDWPSWFDWDRAIVFDSERDGDWDIYQMDSGGAGKIALVNTRAKEVDPSASSSSPWVVFSSDLQDPGGDRQIFRVAVDTGETIQLTDNERTTAHPALSPDGFRIAFNSGKDFWDVYIMNTDGSEMKRLTKGNFDDKWPAWSPDGKRLAVTSNRDGNWEIYLMDINGSNQRRLTHRVKGR